MLFPLYSLHARVTPRIPRSGGKIAPAFHDVYRGGDITGRTLNYNAPVIFECLSHRKQ